MGNPNTRFRVPYECDGDEVGVNSAVSDFGPSLTVQSMSEDADINVLMYRYGITGKMPENPRLPEYMDVPDGLDYRTALEYVQNADAAFMEYPAVFRAQFDNDPQKFLTFVESPGNIEALDKMGLLKEDNSHVRAIRAAAAARSADQAAGAGAGGQPGGAQGAGGSAK